MTSEPIRDPHADHLLTPDNAGLVIIDYQPVQVSSVRTIGPDALIDNIVRVAKTAMLYKLPVMSSTVNVTNGRNKPTIQPFPPSMPWDEDFEVYPVVDAVGGTSLEAHETAYAARNRQGRN